MQTNDAKQYRLNPNCFEKTKVRWGIFKKLSPTKLHSEQSAPLAANGRIADVRLCVGFVGGLSSAWAAMLC